MTHEKKRPTIRPKKPEWFYEYEDEPVGPVDEPTLRRAARQGHLTQDTLVWRKDFEDWRPAKATPPVLAILREEARADRIGVESPTKAAKAEPKPIHALTAPSVASKQSAPRVASSALSGHSDLPPDESWDADLISEEAETQIFAPSRPSLVTSNPEKALVATPHPSPVFAAPRPSGERRVPEPPGPAGSAQRAASPPSVERAVGGSALARQSASVSPGHLRLSRPPPKPRMPEPRPRYELGDALSEDEEVEPPIQQEHVREVLERAEPPRPSRPRASLMPAASTLSIGPRASSGSPAGAPDRAPVGRSGSPRSLSDSPRVEAAVRVDGAQPSATIQALPLWAKVAGIAALFLLGMGAVLLSGRTRSAPESPTAESVGQPEPVGSSNGPEEPASVAKTRQAPGPRVADRIPPAGSAPAAGPAESTSPVGSARVSEGTSSSAAPAVVITEGPLPAGVFEKKLDQARPMFDQQCWQKLRATRGEVAQEPSLSVEIAISAWGQIDKLVPGEAPAGYRGVGRCIIGRIRGWNFPHSTARTLASLRIAPVGE